MLGVLCHLLYVVVSGILGVRLLRRGLRTKSAAERLLGLALLGAGGFGYLFMLIPAALGPDVTTPLMIAFSVVGRILVDAGMLAMLAFTLTVFHPGKRWARWIAGALVGATVVSVIGMFLAGDWWGTHVGSVAYWGEIAGAQGALAWATWEAARYWRQLRRRQVLGLVSDPEVPNRVLLWTGFGMAQLALMAAVTVTTYIYATSGRILLSLDAVISACGLVSAVCLWLAFWPPQVYRSWVAGNVSQGT